MYGLQFSDIYARVQDYANITNIEGSAAKAKIAVNDALRRIAADRRWLALRRTGTITPVTSQQAYALTSLTGFNYPVRAYYVSNGLEQPIDIVSEDIWAKYSDNSNVGDPCICAFLDVSGTPKIYLSPLPSSSFVSQYGTIYIDYDKKPTELSADADIPEIPNTNSQMALVYYAVSELCLKQSDLSGATAWEAKGQLELNKFIKADINFRGMKRKQSRPMFGILDGVNGNRVSNDYKE